MKQLRSATFCPVSMESADVLYLAKNSAKRKYRKVDNKLQLNITVKFLNLLIETRCVVLLGLSLWTIG